MYVSHIAMIWLWHKRNSSEIRTQVTDFLFDGDKRYTERYSVRCNERKRIQTDERKIAPKLSLVVAQGSIYEALSENQTH